MTFGDGNVIVIGSAGIDVKAQAETEIEWETANLGIVRNSVGGVARNIAENLARLEVSTVLLSAIGRDATGRRVLRQTRERGVDVSHVRVVAGARTGAYVALLRPDGELMTAVSDFAVMERVDAAYLRRHEPLIAGAALIVVDANLSEAALETVFELATRYGIRVGADPTSPQLAPKLVKYLSQLYFVVPNSAETRPLCGLETAAHDRESALAAARHLVALGVQLAVVTLGEHGLAYADGSGSGYIRALHTQVLDPTGAGDAFTGAVIFGLVNEVPVDEAMRLGVTAASLTLQTRETVVPELSQELLYARLVV